MKEIFRDYPLDNRYKVSNLGNVIGTRGKLLKPNSKNMGYLKVDIADKTRTIHQLVAETFLGYERDGTNKTVVDHINNIKTDNTLSNLRIVSHRDNMSRLKRVSKYVGVSPSGGRWQANACFNYKQVYLGLFNTQEEARDARQAELDRRGIYSL